MAIQFNFDYDKSVQVFIYLREKQKKIGFSLDTSRFMQLCFFADMYHINKYSRFIFGGCYEAVEGAYRHLELSDLIDSVVNPINRSPNEDIFSESDIEALNYALSEYGDLNTREIIDITRKNSAGRSSPVVVENMIENAHHKKRTIFINEEKQKFKAWLNNV